MPNRVLRDEILTDEQVNSLDARAELFYRRLKSVHDDYGRYYANPRILRSACYPVQVDRVREADISRWLAECKTAGLIVLYEADGKQYLQVRVDDEPRAKGSKFPAPPAGACAHMNASASNGEHMRPYSGSDTRSNSNTNPPTPHGGGEGGEVPKTAKGVEIPEPLRSSEFVDAWRDWETHLRKKRVKTTDLADRQQLAECVSWGVGHAVRAIRFSISKNYQGLFAPREGTNGETTRQRAERLAAEA